MSYSRYGAPPAAKSALANLKDKILTSEDIGNVQNFCNSKKQFFKFLLS